MLKTNQEEFHRRWEKINIGSQVQLYMLEINQEEIHRKCKKKN